MLPMQGVYADWSMMLKHSCSPRPHSLMSSPLAARDIPLPNFNSTNVWFAPGTQINSTQAFSHATHLEAQAYVANRYTFVAMMVVLMAFVIWQIPYTIARMRSAPSMWYNFMLLSPGRKATSAELRRPHRIRHILSPIPIGRVPVIGLTLPEFLLVFALWAVGIGVSAWCQASFLTHASRSTLVVMALLSLTAGLGVKSGGIGTWVVKGYTAVNFLHRWTGRLVLLLSTLHVVAYLVVFYKAGIAKQEMAKPENYLAAMAYGGLCLTGVASIRVVRRKWWLLFKFGHHLGILLLLAGLNYHSGDVVPYLLAIWALLLINTVIRSITSRLTTANLHPLVGSDSTLVVIPTLSRGFTPGQHVRLRVLTHMPWSSVFESHPFTISTADGGETGVQLVVKAAGDWTRRLNDLPAGTQVRCIVDGPYGGPVNFLFPAFSSVLVVVGGSGISFGLGVVRGLMKDVRDQRAMCKNISLVWTVRTKGNLQALSDQISELLTSTDGSEATRPDFLLDVVLAYTAKESDDEKVVYENVDNSAQIPTRHSGPARCRLIRGRPTLKKLLDDLIARTQSGGVGVGACGPAAMVENVEKLVRGVSVEERRRVGGVEIHCERFSL